MPKKAQRLESEVQAAMAAVRGTKADPELRASAESTLTDLHQHASSDEYPNKAVILSAVEQAWDAFQKDNYPGALQHLSQALIAVTRI